MKEHIIEFKNISKSFGDKCILNDVSLNVKKGEFLTILGPSGCGKTTMLRIIGGFETPDSGEMYFDNKSVKDVPPHKRPVNTVFQKYALFPHLNVFENVAFAMHVVGASNKEIRKEVSKALSKVGLGHKARSMPSQLSGGEQQRVGLARALVNSPDLIIADEPTGNVDPNMSYEIVSLLTEINKRGTTILMVTHDHNLVRDFQHRVIMLEEGRIVADNAAGGGNI